MKLILLTLSLMVGGAQANACSLSMNYPTMLKNNIVVAVANQYGADITESNIEVIEFNNQYIWKFTDSSYMCHDTDLVFADIRLSFKSFDSGNCTVRVKADQTVGPEVEGGETKNTITIEPIEKMKCEEK